MMTPLQFLRRTPLLALFSLGCLGLLSAACGQTEPIEWVEEEPETDNQSNNNDPNLLDGNPKNASVVKLFDQMVTLAGGYSQALQFQAPDDVRALTVSVTGGPQNAQYMLTGWLGPDEFFLVPNNWESRTQSGICFNNCNNRIAGSMGAFGALAPNNPESKVVPGDYAFKVVGLQMGSSIIAQPTPLNGEVRVTVYAKVAEQGLPDQAVLDLNIFFTGVNGWTAETAADDPEFQQALAGVDQIYDQIGVTLGEISYNDADDSFQVIEDTNSGDGDLGELFQLSAQAPLEGPSLFIVGELRNAMFGGGGGAILGIAGGIPGPMIIDGSVRSGVAVAYDSIAQPGFDATLSHVIAHELGHYLGLFHTTEQFQFPGMPGHDPLPDTPQNDPTYLMHATGGGDNMSPWQGRVIRANPWTRFAQD